MRPINKVGLSIMIIAAPYLPVFDGWRNGVITLMISVGFALFSLLKEGE